MLSPLDRLLETPAAMPTGWKWLKAAILLR
jgi:hypothetical protein